MGGILLSEWSGSGATRELHETIKLQIVAMDRQSKVIVRLTWVMLFLAAVQTVATVVQAIPIVQGFQNRQAANNLTNPTDKLDKKKPQSEITKHNTTPSPKLSSTPNPSIKRDALKRAPYVKR
jgi:hypothetical protein